MQKPQHKKSLANLLWGENGDIYIVLLIALVALFAFLGAKELWTQEWRWANIAHQMIIRHDFFHPYLAGTDYYDKPLLSYWFIIGVSYLIEHFNLWAVRLPSAIAGFLTIWATFELGKTLSSRRTGIIAAWMLLSSFYFIFWARVGNSDMLNIAGFMLALVWYFKHRNAPGFFNYAVFFLILAVACLLKGLIAAAITFLVIIPDLLYRKNWKKHLNISVFLALIPAAIVYLAPFIASAYMNPHQYAESGLIEVFRENILRYIAPFDHKQPFYIYFKYLPLAIAPWILFTIPALITLPRRWRSISIGSRWMFWSLIIIFLFFTISGSRRDYYVLPMIPFAVLFTADWISLQATKQNFVNKLAGLCALIFTILVLLAFVVVMPLAYSSGGASGFTKLVKQQAEKTQPWNKWKVQVLATRDNMTYYMRSNHLVVAKKARPETSKNPTKENLSKDFPILIAHDPDTIIVIGKNYLPILKGWLTNYTIIQTPPNLGNRILKNVPKNVPVAFIPKIKQKI